MRTRTLTVTAALALVAGTSMAQIVRPREEKVEQQPQWRQDAPARGTVIGSRVRARHELVPVDWIIGTRVLGQDRERLGDLNDIVIDTQNGRAIYGLLEHGGLLGMGERHIAVPWRTFDWDQMNRVLTLPLSSDRLGSAPQLDREDWQRLGDASFRARFDDFFGREGYDDGRAEARFMDHVKRSPAITVRGVVRDIDTMEPAPGVGNYRVLRVQAEDGREHTVAVAPQWFVDRQRRLFQRGEQVQVSGTNLDMEGTRELVVARTVNTPRGTFRFRQDDGRAVWDLGYEVRDERQEERREERPEDRPGLERRWDNRGRGILDPDVRRQGDREAREVRAEGRGLLVRARDLRGQRVTDPDNNDLGRLDTFLINPANGKMGYAVISTGGFLGVGEEKYAVPWSAFTVNQQGKLVSSKMSREQLENAPRIETRNWSELQDPEFGRRVFQHYGAAMDWDRDDDAEDRGRTEAHELIGLFDRGAATDFSGTVVRVDRAGLGGVADLVVRADGGERVVKLLPANLVDNALLRLDEGDRVSVRGRHAMVDGRRVVIAEDISADGRTYQLRDEYGRPEVRVRR